MRTIRKRGEPSSLVKHRKTDHANYDNYDDKDILREYLLAEQRGLCCYCMQVIAKDRMKIEHWHCQDVYPAEQLDYGNLLGACMGREGYPRHEQHCDTSKQNRDLSRNPADPKAKVEDLIQYLGDGSIKSEHAGFHEELNEVLNLNVPYLKENRKATLDGFKKALDKKGSLKPETIERMIRRWNGEDDEDSRLKPYCQVIVYWLRKRLARC